MGLFDAVKEAFESDPQKLADWQKDLADLQAKLVGASGAEADSLRAQIGEKASQIAQMKAKLGITDEAPALQFDIKPIDAPVEAAAAPAAPVIQAAPAAAPAAPPPAPPAPPAQRTYTVKKGDTLSAIGRHFGVPYMAIAKLNNIKNPDLIYPGQVFKIPN